MLMISTPIRNPYLPNPGQRRLYVDIRLASLMKNLFCNDTKGMMNNGTSASRNGNKMSKFCNVAKPSTRTTRGRSLKLPASEPVSSEPKHEGARNVARSIILKTQNRTRLKLPPSRLAPRNLQHIKSCNMLQSCRMLQIRIFWRSKVWKP